MAPRNSGVGVGGDVGGVWWCVMVYGGDGRRRRVVDDGCG